MNDYDKYQSEDQTNRVNSGIALNRNTNDVLGSIFYDCTKKIEIVNDGIDSEQTRTNLLNVNPIDNSFYGSEQHLNYPIKGRGKFARTYYQTLQFDQIVGYINEEKKVIVFFTIDNTKSDHGRIKGKFGDAVILRSHFGEIWYLNFRKIFSNINLDEYKCLIIPIVNLPAHLSPNEYKNIKRDIDANIKLIRDVLGGISKYNENGLGISFAMDIDALSYFFTKCYAEKICDEKKMLEILYEYYPHPIYHLLPIISLASIDSNKEREVILWYIDNKPRSVDKKDLKAFIEEYNEKYSANIEIKLFTTKKALLKLTKEIIHSLYGEE